MYSVNVPVPGEVRSLIHDLRPTLVGFKRVREHQTLLVKRLDANDRREYLQAARDAKAALRGAPQFEVRITGCGVFETPLRGPGPLVYLAVESPGLRRVHEQLTAKLGAIEELEGDDYTPHVTLARDGPRQAVNRVLDADFDPVTWTVTELELYDARHHERIEALPLPA